MRTYQIINSEGKLETRYELTASEVYNKLLNEEQICNEQGQIRFYLGDVNIIVKQKDVVGNIIQEWLQGWLSSRHIDFDPSTNPQMPPDFYLNKGNHDLELLEVKAFNSEASPAFDIADFKGFARAVLQSPSALNTNFLIFAYKMSENGYVSITKIWLKKLWEITRISDRWPVNVQYKNGEINKIRPAAASTWDKPPVKQKGNKFPHFANLSDFLSAFRETLMMYGETHALGSTWKKDLNASFAAHDMPQIDFPWWDSIKQNYE